MWPKLSISMKKGQIRIIGGQFGGRKLNFPSLPGVRPTPNRIRETVFNWLNPIITSAHCLDLFAGTGALGIEALSRNAKSVAFIERSLILYQYLTQEIKRLGIEDKAKVYRSSFPFNATHLFKQKPVFNLVFLDPPFHKNLIAEACHWLITEKLLLAKSTIYIEMEASIKKIYLPEKWQINQCKIAGQVKYALITTAT
jgi:16S rRNA (guanine966-N2)-methyltransferase